MKKYLVTALLISAFMTPQIAGAKAQQEYIAPSTPRQFQSSAGLNGAGLAEITIVATEADSAKAASSMSQALSDASAKANLAMTTISSVQPNTPVEIDPWLYVVLERCRAFSALTNGAFDITGTGDKDSSGLFKRDWRSLKLKDGTKTLTLKGDGIQIDPKTFGTALRGFLADEIMSKLTAEGWRNVQVIVGNTTRNIGRDIHTQWTIRMDAPTAAEKGKNAFRAYNYSVSDVGTAMISPALFPEGIIDPRSNTLITSPAVINTMIFAADAATASAYAIATYANSAAKAEQGLQFVHSHPEVKGILIGLDGNVLTSTGLGVSKSNQGESKEKQAEAAPSSTDKETK